MIELIRAAVFQANDKEGVEDNWNRLITTPLPAPPQLPPLLHRQIAHFQITLQGREQFWVKFHQIYLGGVFPIQLRQMEEGGSSSQKDQIQPLPLHAPPSTSENSTLIIGRASWGIMDKIAKMDIVFLCTWSRSCSHCSTAMSTQPACHSGCFA